MFTKCVEIKRLQVAVSKLIPANLITLRKNLHIAKVQPADIDGWVYQLLTFINHTDKTIERRYEQVPVTWMDLFKQTYFPTWLLQKFPIKYRQIETSVKLNFLCPHEDYGHYDKPSVHVAFLAQGDNK